MISGDDSTTRRASLRLRPKPGLIRSGLLILLIVPLPIFGILFFQSAVPGTWPIAAGGEIFSLALCWLGFVRFRDTFVAVDADGIVERGFFGGVTKTPLADIETMALVRTYSTSSAETVSQLVASDVTGASVLRMRGEFWTEASMRAVAEAAGMALDVVEEPITAAQFFDRFPDSAYWFENRRAIVVAGAVVASVVCIGIVLGLMQLLASPVSGN